MSQYPPQFSLAGKSAIVTGGNRGLGLAFTRALLEAGADVAVIHRQQCDVHEVVTAAKEHGRRVHVLHADLSDGESRSGLISRAAEQLGKVDILVNNAGITHREPAIDFPMAQWTRILEVNLTAVFELSQQAARLMRKTGSGRIINVASMMSYLAGWTIPAYTASKAGIAGLTRALANEWAAHNITVNAIAPGYFLTDVTRPLQEDRKRNAEILDHIPMGRWGDPMELCGALLLLASHAGGYITGQLIAVDGGYLIR